MKKFSIIFALFLMVCLSLAIPAFAADDDWASQPVITDVYEVAKEKVCIEWEGNSVIYQVYVDGKVVDTVNINSATVSVKPGKHQIIVVPISYSRKDVNRTVEFNIGDFAGGSIDLGAIGIDPKDTIQGTASEVFKLNYKADPFTSAVPQISTAYTDYKNTVNLYVTDKYNADRYTVAVKNGKDITYVEFDTASKEATPFISKTGSTVLLVLNKDFLKKQSCMVPELDNKYSFSVKLAKYPKNYVDNELETTSAMESKESKFYDYSPYAAWKNAPEISLISQTAEGQVTIRWVHDDYDKGCEYKIISQDKGVSLKKGKNVVGSTSEHSFVVKDLMNGKHSFTVVPVLKNEEGIASDKAEVEVANSWVTAPALEYEILKDNKIKLKWDSSKEVESYHITVYAGSGSLLRFVNMDYKKYKEIDVNAKTGSMEYVFEYDGAIPETGLKLKFEIYGVRHAEKGEVQKSAVSKLTVAVE